MTTTYLVDTENVGTNWSQYLSDASSGDKFLLFFTPASKTLSYAVLSMVLASHAKCECIPCYTGQNALDFQLVTELGRQIARNSSKTFVIFTNDKGYDAAVKYWVDRGVHVERIPLPTSTSNLAQTSADPQTCSNAVSEIPKKTTEGPVESPSVSLTKEQQILSKLENKISSAGISRKNSVEITRLLLNTTSLPKQQRLAVFYKRMIAKFGAKSGLTMYQKARPIFVNFLKNGKH